MAKRGGDSKPIKVFIPYDSFVCDAYLELDEYVEELRPSRDQLTAFTSATDTLVDWVRQTPGISVFHVKKGGPVTRDTATVDSLHLDVSIFLAVKGLTELNKHMASSLERIEQQLSKHRWAEEGRMRVCGRTNVGFCPELGVHVIITDPDTGDTYTADFYPAFDVLGAVGNDMWTHKQHDKRDKWKQRIEDLASPPSVIQMYTQFMSEMSTPAVRDLIRLVWKWRKTCFMKEKMGDKRRLPDAFLIELLVLDCWEDAGRPETFSMLHALKSCLTRLTNPGAISACWTFYYDRILIDRYFTGKLGNFQNRVLVVDPVNPWNNRADTCNAWEEFAEVAKAAVAKPRLATVANTKHWQEE